MIGFGTCPFGNQHADTRQRPISASGTTTPPEPPTSSPGEPPAAIGGILRFSAVSRCDRARSHILLKWRKTFTRESCGELENGETPRT
jgi:hypothetical protein